MMATPTPAAEDLAAALARHATGQPGHPAGPRARSAQALDEARDRRARRPKSPKAKATPLAHAHQRQPGQHRPA